MNMLIPLPEDNPMSFWLVVTGVVDLRSQHPADRPGPSLAVRAAWLERA